MFDKVLHTPLDTYASKFVSILIFQTENNILK